MVSSLGDFVFLCTLPVYYPIVVEVNINFDYLVILLVYLIWIFVPIYLHLFIIDFDFFFSFVLFITSKLKKKKYYILNDLLIKLSVSFLYLFISDLPNLTRLTPYFNLFINVLFLIHLLQSYSKRWFCYYYWCFLYRFQFFLYFL